VHHITKQIVYAFTIIIIQLFVENKLITELFYYLFIYKLLTNFNDLLTQTLIKLFYGLLRQGRPKG
jgi:hypothetical protein